MPELPEVETVVRGLRRTIVGRTILSVSLKKTDFIDDANLLEEFLPGQQIISVERYGKFMLLRLAGLPARNDSTALLVHLGMTGHIASVDVVNPWEKHTHVGMLLDDGRELRYTDARRFGRMAYLAGETLDNELARFGVDPLEMSKTEFAQTIRSRTARIKALLLDQRVLRGVGNIYADESLWKAKIHPARLASSLTLAHTSLLRRSLQQILLRAIVLRGSTISNFADTDGSAGEYQQHHQVYGRAGQPCYRCGKTIRRAIVAGRSSYFCPGCQGMVRGTNIISKKKKRTKLPGRRKNTEA
jgi:formamidopyrimidine-DNA glycosylase